MDQRDVVIRTIIGESANESPDGWAAVAHVLKNRAMDPRWPDEVGAVALQPMQFSAWNKGVGGNDLVTKYGPDDPIYQQIGQVVDAVFSGEIPDNTGGATHYYSPAGMQAHVDRGEQSNLLPRWLQDETDRRGGGTTTIGGHVFTGLREGAPQQVALEGQVNMPRGPAGAPISVTGETGAPGFTPEQINAALQEAEDARRTVSMPEQQQAPMQMAPRQQAPAYQPQTDSITQAMQVFANLQQKRRGLLG